MGPVRRGPPRPRGSAFGLSPERLLARISLECRCLIFAPRLRVVCPTPDSWRSFLVGEVRGAFRQTCLEASRKRRCRFHGSSLRMAPRAIHVAKEGRRSRQLVVFLGHL